jgi:GNAT superfamily N-acetyltransferase
MDWMRSAYTISTDPSRLELETIHAFLANSYWARGIPRDILDRAIANSLCFGVYEGTRQAGFARVITDKATYAYLADVFVLESHRGKGLGKWLVEVILAHPDLSGLRRWGLVTWDAHGLYSRIGFTALSHPERHMEISNPDIYLRQARTPPAR